MVEREANPSLERGDTVFFGTADPDFTDVNGIPFDAEYQSHNIEIGLRFSF